MKKILFVLIFIGIYATALKIKDIDIKKNNSRELPTFYQSWEKNGIPVHVAKVKEDNLTSFATVTGQKTSNGIIRAEVTPQIAAHIKNGAKALYKDNSLEFKGKVTSISNSSSILTGLYEVTLLFSDLKTNNKYLILDVETKTLPKTNVIPITSVSLREAKPFVYKVVEENKIEKEYVEITGKNFESYAIKANLKAGDLVVTSDLRDLNPNQKVLIVE